MSLTFVAVTFDAHDPAGLASFWGSLLDRQVVHEAGVALLPADDTQVGLRFVAATTEKSGRNRLHLHLTSTSLEDQQRTVALALSLGGRHLDVGQLPDTTEKSGRNRLHLHLTSTSLEDQQRTVALALSLGGRHLDVGQLPEEDHVVFGDPAGNEFCVIEPGNNFLAGCGYLGEVSCEGSREVGLYWRDALGWSLVWDRDEETAVQSPAGGTKVSWGGPPVSPKQTRNRQRFDLTFATSRGSEGA